MRRRGLVIHQVLPGSEDWSRDETPEQRGHLHQGYTMVCRHKLERVSRHVGNIGVVGMLHHSDAPLRLDRTQPHRAVGKIAA